jgi:hypothetical protein
LPTAPGCNALAALRPLFSFTRNDTQLPQWLYAVWHFLKKMPWLPETNENIIFCQTEFGNEKNHY